MSRPLAELQFRAGVLGRVPTALRAECIAFAAERSPRSAYDQSFIAARMAHGMNVLQAMAVAKATRWLAVIRRDHGQDIFNEAARTLAASSDLGNPDLLNPSSSPDSTPTA